jgi:hypothetical protein
MGGIPQIVIDTEYGDILLKNSKARPAVPAEKVETQKAEAEENKG